VAVAVNNTCTDGDCMSCTTAEVCTPEAGLHTSHCCFVSAAVDRPLGLRTEDICHSYISTSYMCIVYIAL
jgi:hypothetical protein